jgi:hypothetical protein
METEQAGALLRSAHTALVALAQITANPEERPGFSGLWQNEALLCANLHGEGYAAKADTAGPHASAHQHLLHRNLHAQAAGAMAALAGRLQKHPATQGLFSDQPGWQGLGLSFDRAQPHRIGLAIGGWKAQPLRGSYATLDRFPCTIEDAAAALEAALATTGPHSTHLLLDARRAWEAGPVQAAASTLQALTVLVAGTGKDATHLWCAVGAHGLEDGR